MPVPGSTSSQEPPPPDPAPATWGSRVAAIADRFRRSFTYKLGALIFAMSLVPVLLTAVVVMQLAVSALRADAFELVRVMRDAAADKTNSFFQERLDDVEGWALLLDLSDPKVSSARKSQMLERLAALHPAYRSLSLVDPTSRVTASSDAHELGRHLKSLTPGRLKGPSLRVDLDHRQASSVVLAQPLAGSRISLVAVIDTEPLRRFFRHTRVRGSGESYLLGPDGRMVTETRFRSTRPIGDVVDTEGRRAALAGLTGVAVYQDYRGVPVVGAYIPIHLTPESGTWAVVSELDVEEAMAPVRLLKVLVAVFTLGLIVLITMLVAFATRRISQPLRALDEAAAGISSGQLERRVPADSEDEFGRVALTFNHMADHLQRQVVSLQAMTTKLQELDRFKNDYIHAISHDLRNPLMLIQGYVELLDDTVAGQDASPQRDYTLQIERAARRLELMVEDLLDAARLEAGSFKLEREDLDLAERVRGLVESMQPAATEAGLSLTADLPDTPLTACVDGERIDRVIANLVGNALKFTPRGGRVRVMVCPDPAGIRCEVADTGKGIAESDVPKLFQRFSQLENGRRFKGSTGLGLAISKAIVEAHGGRIGVDSVEGEGSTFWFTLPTEPPAAEPAPPPEHAA